MTTQETQRSLTMRVEARSIINRVITDTNPVIRYRVFDERGKEMAFITNTRASSLAASWRISRIRDGRVGGDVGDYSTAEDALSALQKETNQQR